MTTANPTSDNSDARDGSTDTDEQNDDPTFQDRFGFSRDGQYAAVVGKSISSLTTPWTEAKVDHVDSALAVDCKHDGVSISVTAVTPDSETKFGTLGWMTPAQARHLASALLDAADDWEAWDSENNSDNGE